MFHLWVIDFAYVMEFTADLNKVHLWAIDFAYVIGFTASDEQHTHET